jgi:CheY-like chemotaxis protein
MRCNIFVADQNTDECFLMAEAFRIVCPNAKVRELQDLSSVFTLEGDRSNPDLIVMDYLLLGLLSSEQLIKITDLFNIPLVVLSADPHYREKAQTRDALEFYEKPGTLEGFLSLARVISQHSK